MAHLKLASAADAEPDKSLVELAESILAQVKSGEIESLFLIADCGPRNRMAAWAGDFDPDAVAGFSARVLASMANAEG